MLLTKHVKESWRKERKFVWTMKFSTWVHINQWYFRSGYTFRYNLYSIPKSIFALRSRSTNTCCLHFSSPEVAEPLDKLRGVVLVELHIREVDFQAGGARISNVEEHQLGLAEMHRRQCTGVMSMLRFQKM